MLVNHEHGCGEGAKRYHRRRRMVWRPQKINQQRHRRGRGNRTQRDKARKQHHKDKNTDSTQRRGPTQSKKHPRSGCDTFPAAKAQPYGKAMAHQRCKAGDCHPQGAFVRKPCGKPYRRGAFHAVEHQGEDAGQRSSHARNVRRANIAAASLPHIDAPEHLCQDNAEGN